MGVKVYGMELSAPVRCVMMTCEALKVEYEFIVVNLMAGEHMKPDYLKVCYEMISYQLVYLFESKYLLLNLYLDVNNLMFNGIFTRSILSTIFQP